MKKYLYLVISLCTFFAAEAQSPEGLKTILREHADDVECVAYSPDGKFLATGGWDKTIRIFSIDSAINWYGTLYGHDAAVTSLCFSRDSKKLISGGNDFNTIIWVLDSTANFMEQKRFRFSTLGITSVVYGLSLKTIFSAGLDGKIISYDLDKKIERKIDNKQQVNNIAVSSDQRNIYCADNDAVLKQYDIKGNVSRTFEGHTDAINAVAIALNNKFLVTGSSDKTAMVWDVLTGKNLFKLEGHEWKVTSVAVSLDNKYIVTGSTDGSVKLWNAADGSLMKTFQGAGNQVTGVSISPDNKTIAAATHLESTFEEGFGAVLWNTGIEPPPPPQRPVAKRQPPANAKPAGNAVKDMPKPQQTDDKKVIKKTDEVEITIEDNKKNK